MSHIKATQTNLNGYIKIDCDLIKQFNNYKPRTRSQLSLHSVQEKAEYKIQQNEEHKIEQKKGQKLSDIKQQKQEKKEKKEVEKVGSKGQQLGEKVGVSHNVSIQSQMFANIVNGNFDLKCNICGKRGHVGRYCRSNVKIFCTICLGDHWPMYCANVICPRCGAKGHNFPQCEALGQIPKLKCNGCLKFGHIAQNCRVIEKNDLQYSTENKKIDMEDMKLVKCLKCNKLGHTNCYQYPDMIPNIYKKL